MYRLKIDIDPVALPRQTRADKWKKRPCVLKYRAYRDELRLRIGKKSAPGNILLRFAVPMPKSWSKKKKEAMVGMPHKSRPDLDNYIKGVLDCWPEDSHVHTVSACKVWSKEGQVCLEWLE